MNEQTIKSRIEGRKHAMTVLDLATDSGPVGVNSAFWISFWDTIRDEAKTSLVNLGQKEPEPKPPALKPMDDAEAKRFELTHIRFGKYQWSIVGKIIVDDPAYLDWLCRATEEDTFKADLRRYLSRKDIQDALPD